MCGTNPHKHCYSLKEVGHVAPMIHGRETINVGEPGTVHSRLSKNPTVSCFEPGCDVVPIPDQTGPELGNRGRKVLVPASPRMHHAGEGEAEPLCNLMGTH